MADVPETRIETYIPLYRKYRPQTFADLVGQEAISQTLGNAINLNKVAHAYLFCGPRGTGKTSSARIFAKSLNCEQGPTVTPCLTCASCTGIANGNALDVVEFDAASNNGVGDARELIENCQYSSLTGRFKVYIIDEVHMLTSQAFNALLKTLEEPPPNVIFIFATTEAHKVLPTIISRCQRFDFNRITTENIVERLRFIAAREQIAIDGEALLMIARHARGGLRDAVGLLDQVSVLGRANPDKTIVRQDVAMFIGTLEEDLLLRLAAAIAERRAADLLNELNALTARGIEPIQLVKDLTVHFRNLLLVQAAGERATPGQLELPPDYFAQLVAQARLFPEAEEIPQIIARFSFVERNVRTSNQPQLWLEVGLIELAYRHEIQLVKDLSERVNQLEARLEALAGGAAPVAPAAMAAPARPAPLPARPTTPVKEALMRPGAAPAAPPASPAPAANPQPSAPVSQSGSERPTSPPPAANQPTAGGNASLQAEFNQICQMVASMTARSLFQQQAFPVSLDGNVLVIGCASEPNLVIMKKPDKVIHLQKAVDKFYGRPIRIDLVLEKKPTTGEMQAPAVQPTPAAPLMPETKTAEPSHATPPQPVPSPVAEEAPSPEPVPAPAPELAMVGATSAQAAATEPQAALAPENAPAPDEALAAARAQVTFETSPEAENDPELAESKRYALELLQGKILD